MALGWLLLSLTARGLDALTLGEDAAASLGIGLTRLRLMIVFGTASAVGAATAVAGAIGFVGLVVPHILRPFLGARPALLLPASALGGARAGACCRHRGAPGPARPGPEARRAHGDRRRAAVPAPDLQDAEAARVTLLTLNGITVRRGECPVVDNATLAIGAGEVVGLIGPNGAGKTTLMRAALGLLPATGENSLLNASPRERAKRIAWLPQAREIAWPVTVETLVMLGRVPHMSGGQRPGPRGWGRGRRRAGRHGPCSFRSARRDRAFGRRTGPCPDRPRAGAGHAPDPRR
jgi:hypothetical protein